MTKVTTGEVRDVTYPCDIVPYALSYRNNVYEVPIPILPKYLTEVW